MGKRIEAIDKAFYKFAAYCYKEDLQVAFKGGCLLEISAYTIQEIRE